MSKILLCFLMIFFGNLYALKSQSTFSPANRVAVPVNEVRQVPQKKVDAYLKNPVFDYANNPAYWKPGTQPAPGLFSKLLNAKVFRWAVFLTLLGVIVYGIYKLSSEKGFRWTRGRKFSHAQGLHENGTEKLTDYDESIRQYQLQENYRLAVRFLYLKLIDQLKENTNFGLKDSTTNEEILSALKSPSDAAEFRFLSRAYEYVFYGEYVIEQNAYGRIKKRFEQFHPRT